MLLTIKSKTEHFVHKRQSVLIKGSILFQLNCINYIIYINYTHHNCNVIKNEYIHYDWEEGGG